MLYLTGRIKDTHYRELSIAEPHHPASAICSSASATHPPRNDPAGPPGEPSQLPEHQLPNAEAPAILVRHRKQIAAQAIEFLLVLSQEHFKT